MRSWRRLLVVAIVLLAAGRPEAWAADGGRYLAGRLLVAGDKLVDPYFIHSVVYLVEHDAEGAIGLIVNRAVGAGDLNNLLKGFGLTPGGGARPVTLHFGGPVAASGVFILHTPDYRTKGTLSVPDGLRMTGEKAILEAIAAGRGPARMKVMVGYAGWGPGQLEKEIARGDWLDAEAEDDFVFDAEGDARDQWIQARERAGLTL